MYTGKGSYKRIKEIIEGHVEETHKTMFDSAFRLVKKRLEEMRKTLQEQMIKDTDRIFVALKRDYSTTLFGSSEGAKSEMSEAEIEMRAQMKEVLKTYKAEIVKILNANEGIPTEDKMKDEESRDD